VRRTTPRALLAISTLAVGLGGPASATTLQAMSLEELARAADLVVKVRVGDHRCEWRQRLIYTLTQAEVLEVLKGPQTARVTIAQLGGRVGDQAMPVPGTAALQRDEIAVLFLERNRDAKDEHFLVGMSQGKLAVRQDAQLHWAPTASLWDGATVREPQARAVSADELRRALRAAQRRSPPHGT